MTKKLVWIVENIETGQVRSNWSTGTRIYSRKKNAEAALKRAWRRTDVPSPYRVVEYELVPTEKEDG